MNFRFDESLVVSRVPTFIIILTGVGVEEKVFIKWPRDMVPFVFPRALYSILFSTIVFQDIFSSSFDSNLADNVHVKSEASLNP